MVYVKKLVDCKVMFSFFVSAQTALIKTGSNAVLRHASSVSASASDGLPKITTHWTIHPREKDPRWKGMMFNIYGLTVIVQFTSTLGHVCHKNDRTAMNSFCFSRMY